MHHFHTTMWRERAPNEPHHIHTTMGERWGIPMNPTTSTPVRGGRSPLSPTTSTPQGEGGGDPMHSATFTPQGRGREPNEPTNFAQQGEWSGHPIHHLHTNGEREGEPNGTHQLHTTIWGEGSAMSPTTSMPQGEGGQEPNNLRTTRRAGVAQ